MSNDSEKTDKTWKQIIGLIIQAPFWPVHFAIRLIARFLVLAIRSVAILLLLLLLAISSAAYKVFDLALSKVLERVLEALKNSGLPEFPELPYLPVFLVVTIIILSVAIVWLPHLLQRHAKDIKESLLKIKERICEVLRSEWLPGLDIKESLLVTWQDYGKEILPSLIEIFTESRKLYFAIVILCIFFLVYIKVVEFATSSKDEKLEIFNFTTILVDIRTGIVNHLHPGIEEKLVNHPHPDITKEIPDHSHKPSTSYSFEKGTKFLLVYKEGDLNEEGNLKTKKDSLDIEDGICPGGSNLEWLKLFKTAITDSLKDKDGYLKLKIRGFASVAPVLVNGDTTNSNSLNCEIANRRAEALIYFLMLPDSIPYDSTKCKSALENSSMWGRQENELCTRSAVPDTSIWRDMGFDVTYEMRPDTTIVWKRTNFDVAHKPWQSYEEMDGNKPEQGSSPQSRQRDIEFRNRSVQIIIEEGSDWTETIPTPPAEDNTG